MKKKLIVLLLFVLLIGGGFFVWLKPKDNGVDNLVISPSVKRTMEIQPVDFLITSSESKAEAERYELVQSFISSKLMIDGSIVTNYLPSKESLAYATGHDRLSESAGLYLLVLALNENQESFDNFYRETKDLFYRDGQFSYRVTSDGEHYPVNASLDDLRIIRSLIIAKARFETSKYDQDIKKLGANFIQQSTNEGLMVDFYDSESKQKAQDISFFYLDYKTLGYLYQQEQVDAQYLQFQLNLAKAAYISDDFPLFQQKYSYESQQYESGETINIIESLETLRFLAEIGEAPENSIEFVKDNVAKGTLFNAYDKKGNPVDKNQSAASYALAASIGYLMDDQQLFKQALTILKRFQVMDLNQVLYGGFGDTETNQVYSFNNLLALYAYGL